MWWKLACLILALQWSGPCAVCQTYHDDDHYYDHDDNDDYGDDDECDDYDDDDGDHEENMMCTAVHCSVTKTH